VKIGKEVRGMEKLLDTAFEVPRNASLEGVTAEGVLSGSKTRGWEGDSRK
jgi:hypothetical protein